MQMVLTELPSPPPLLMLEIENSTEMKQTCHFSSSSPLPPRLSLSTAPSRRPTSLSVTGPARLPIPKRRQRHRSVKLDSTLVGSTARAIVLVCLFQDDDGRLQVILTKRASTLSSHSGEVSLPGDKRDEGDGDDVDTVLREAKEEIGLEPSLVNVVS